jgi:uncharacterized protein
VHRAGSGAGTTATLRILKAAMSVELRPLGVRCNIACDYCYQNPQRDAGNLPKGYDLEVMKRAILEEGGPFTLFGGEPLMLPERDLEELWSWGFQQFGRNSVQTNGIAITEAHIRLFKRYNVLVGISIDGPGALNDLRWAGSPEKTRAATERTEAAIARLCQENLPPSLIVTLHRMNAGPEALPVLRDWFRRLDRMGISAVRIHLLESEDPSIREQYALPIEDNIRVLMDLAALEPELRTMHFDLFHEVEQLLQGKEASVSCTWRACDTYTTSAVRGVEGQGQRSNCGRTNKDGIDFVKSDEPGYERYLALYQTPQEYGGCRDCRFFLMCKGQCPGTAIDQDWRNRTEHCEIWMQLFRHVEQRLLGQGVEPLSLSVKRIPLERALLAQWAQGLNPRLEQLLEKPVS